MKTFLASLLIAFIFTLSLGIILLIWDINVFQYVDITKILLTILTIVVSSIILCLIWALLFNNGEYRYDKKEGNVAQFKEK
ncbi:MULTISPECIES: hypothetical protein [Gilliamella]|jgi:succinate dehydrogenase/fumarate reductase cytochrome b subunit|uniref:Uncharacterized protein n=1 Tax=Gilliamella intestini TaxID=1798183 RepID=A0A1C4C9M4_9GAMM|nr:MULTISPECIES: hypothetical protein [Gilliamella]OCG46895.1 hypothetical protein A9G35_04375 [Gilliamella apicola]SCC15785.1 hypothetical protein GA0061080_10336 [Gilliamella intestini]